MRYINKLALLVLLAVMVSGNAFAAFTNPPEASIDARKEGLDGRKMGSQPVVIILVRNSLTGINQVGIASEDAVVYDTNSDDGVSVKLTTVSADGALAGIAVTTILTSDAATGTTAYDDYGRRNWGYVLVHGKCTAKVTAGGTNGNVVGAPFITSTDSGAITTYYSFDSAVTVADRVNTVLRIGSNKGGFFYNTADGSSTSVPVQVELE